jgi:XisI protein
MDRLTQTQLFEFTRREVAKYAGISPDAKAYYLADDDRLTYAVVGTMNQLSPDRSWVMLLARIEDDVVVIEYDSVVNKPLIQALLQAGIPRQQIVCAYLGETLPEMVAPTP